MLPGLRAMAFAVVTASCTGEAPPVMPTPQATTSSQAPAPPPSLDAAEPPPRAVEPVTTAANGMGYLTLLCAPACDQVVVDGGTDLGASPMYKAPIPAGKHRLTLRVTVPMAVRVVAVDIHEGEATVVRVDMSP